MEECKHPLYVGGMARVVSQVHNKITLERRDGTGIKIVAAAEGLDGSVR